MPPQHDDWAAGSTTKGDNYRAPLDEELGLTTVATDFDGTRHTLRRTLRACAS